MARAPDYRQQINPPGGISVSVQPMAVPSMDGAGSAFGRSIAQAGSELTKLGERMKTAHDQTRVAVATTDYLTRLDDLEQEATKDPDFLTARQTFNEKHTALTKELLATIPDDNLRARTNLEWTRAGISSAKRVQATAWTREVDANVGALDAQEAEAVRSAGVATSEVERNAAIARYEAALQGGANAGWIDDTKAQARRKRFYATLDTVNVMETIRSDPRRAGALLDDPNNFPNLDPVQREQWKNSAKSAADTNGQLRIVAGAGFNPVGAVVSMGQLADPSQARSVFDRGIIPIESGGRTDDRIVSDAGALGVAQVRPDTAREVAKRLGLNDVAALDDAALKDRLLKDHKLNYRLGLDYFTQMAGRYGGNVWAAAAAYNGGPGRADEWVRKATEKFGPNFTGAQFASVVDIAETKNYLVKLGERTGADMEAGGLSPEARLRTASALGTKMSADATEQRRFTVEVAQAERTLFDLVGIVKQGNQPDPQREALWVERNRDAAAAGDVQAAKALRDYQFAKSMQPVVREAYATSPAQLDQTIAAEEARQASNPITSDEKDRLDVLREVRNEVVKRAHSEPVRLLTRAGLASFVPVDTKAEPDDPQLRSALAQRGGLALSAQRIYRGGANALLEEETRALKERYAGAGADEKFRLLRTFGETLQGAALTDTVAAVTGDAGSAEIVTRFVATRPELARELLSGAELLQQKDVQEKAKTVRATLADKVGGLIYPSPEMQEQAIKAALYLDVGRRAASGRLYDDTDSAGVERALDDVMGPLVKRNGVRVPAPPGMTPSQFHSTLDNLRQEDLDAFGGALDRNGRPLDAAFLGDRAILKPLAIGGSLYVVGLPDPAARDGFGPVWTLSAHDPGAPRPLVIDLRMLAGQVASRPGTLTPYQQGLTNFRAGQTERINAAREGNP